MEKIFGFIMFLVLVAVVGVLAAVAYSEPAPDWYEIEEQNRNRWYK